MSEVLSKEELDRLCDIEGYGLIGDVAESHEALRAKLEVYGEWPRRWPTNYF